MRNLSQPARIALTVAAALAAYVVGEAGLPATPEDIAQAVLVALAAVGIFPPQHTP